jgi:hypothetical protein
MKSIISTRSRPGLVETRGTATAEVAEEAMLEVVLAELLVS